MGFGTVVLTQGSLLSQLPHSTHSYVTIWGYNNRKYVVKRIGRYYSNFTPAEATTLCLLMLDYHRRLGYAGVPVPREFDCWVAGNEVFNIACYTGLSTRYAVNSSTINAWHRVTEGILEAVGRTFDAPENRINAGSCWLRLSLEASPDNFTMDEEGQLTYIDFTPPLRRSETEVISLHRLIPVAHLSESTERRDFRYFNKKGVILWLLTKFGLAWPDSMREIGSTVYHFLLDRKEEQVIEFLRESPATRIWHLVITARTDRRSGQQKGLASKKHAVEQILAGLGHESRDHLRLIAMLLVPSCLDALQDYLAQRGVLLPTHIDSRQALFDHMFMSLRSPSSHDAFKNLVTGIIDYAFESEVDISGSDVWPIASIEL